MRFGRNTLLSLMPLVALVFSACGGSGASKPTSGDVEPKAPKVVTPTAGPDKFLLFPNPQEQDDGSLQTNTVAYAQAYYEAIDPTNSKDTLEKWRAANRFGVGGSESTVVFGDKRDLGYGRLLTGRDNRDGTYAFMVKNFLVGPYGYSPLNLDAATSNASQWHIGTNAIEYSPGPNGGVAFAKFYTFDPQTGARLMMADLDGRGAKAMPGICISCHGGRGDPLTPANGAPLGKPLFPLVVNSVSQHRGDVQARLQPLEPTTYDFSTLAQFNRPALEAGMKAINKMVLCTYPIPAASVATAGPEDACRRVATVNEWQGTAAEHLKSIYGGDGLPSAVSGGVDNFVPTAWASVGQSSLYQTQAQACRACHILRGTGSQDDLNFDSFSKFLGYADRIKAHVVDRGNMPLVKLIYDKYWSTPEMYTSVANFLVNDGYADGALKPGRPVANPGPGRVVKQGKTTLSGTGSLFSTTYEWTLVSGPTNGANLTDVNTAKPTFNASVDGTYKVQLITSNGVERSAPVQTTLEVNNALPYLPASLRFADVKSIIGVGGAGCTSCHRQGGNGSVIPPIWYSNSAQSGDMDRNGDGVVNSVDDDWFYAELRGRVNFTDIVASPILRKPSNKHHNGGLQPGFNIDTNPQPVAQFDASLAGRGNYDKLLNWIANGAPK
jgi:mono/diheme cytochrome c family protein